MMRAVDKLRTHYDKPLRIEALAKELGMSLSGFHAHFKAVTVRQVVSPPDLSVGKITRVGG
jgi:AraC-like DNA-binding protein